VARSGAEESGLAAEGIGVTQPPESPTLHALTGRAIRPATCAGVRQVSELRMTRRVEGGGDQADRRPARGAPGGVADLTNVRTHAGWVYVAFVLAVFSRMVVGWQVSTSLRTDRAITSAER
jgi:transposase InsO family protein